MKFYLSVLSALILCGGIARSTPAQTAPPPTAPIVRSPKTLEDALKVARWDAAQRGVLLTLDPQDVKPPKDTDSGSLEPAGQGGYNVTALADFFGQRVQRFGNVTVLAPPTMVVLNPRPGKPDFAQGGDPQRTSLNRLLPTLTAAQWQLIGGANGIGMGDMTAQQQRIYDRIIENPLTIARAAYSDYTSKDRNARAKARFEAAPKRTLTPEERSAVRLRLKMVSFVYGEQKQDVNGMAFIVLNSKLYDSKGQILLLDRSAKPEKQGSYGVLLSRDLPNRLKKSDLNYDSLRATVHMESPADKPLTVETLLGRIAEANDLNLRVDKRIAQKKIWVRGSEASSGDLLKSLCLSVSGSIRKIGDIYLLTSDIEGLALRRAVVDDWQVAADKVQSSENRSLARQLYEKSQKLNPAQYLSFEETDPVKVSPEIVQKILTRRNQRDTTFGIRVKSDALSPEARTFLNKKAEASTKRGDGAFAARTDEFQIQILLTQSLIVPGMGEVEDGLALNLNSLNPTSLPSPPLLSAKGNILLLHPLTPTTAETAVERSVQTGAAGLWIETTMTEEGLQILKAATAAGEKAKIPITAVVRLMRGQTTHAPASLLDCNIRGEASDWLAPDLPQTYTVLQSAFSDLARVPHLAGIALLDVLPPGYRSKAARFNDDNPSPNIVGWFAEQGYRLQPRLEFLQSQNADPIDIVPYPSYVGIQIPFFPDLDADDALADAWASSRNERAVSLLTRLRGAIERVQPGLPVFLRGEPSTAYPLAYNDKWYVRWDADVALPRLFRDRIDPRKPLAQEVRGKSKQVLLCRDVCTVDDLSDPTPPDPTGADGTVVDLSSDTISEAFAKLEKPK